MKHHETLNLCRTHNRGVGGRGLRSVRRPNALPAQDRLPQQVSQQGAYLV